MKKLNGNNLECDIGAKEIWTITKSGSFKDAKTLVANILCDLGDDAVDVVSDIGKDKISILFLVNL